MLMLLFTDMSLIILDALPSGDPLTQEYFTSNILPGLVQKNMRIFPKDPRVTFFLDVGNSICQNSPKITREISGTKPKSLPWPLYSPDLSPCGFCLLEC
jgi:hypothetical protein